MLRIMTAELVIIGIAIFPFRTGIDGGQRKSFSGLAGWESYGDGQTGGAFQVHQPHFKGHRDLAQLIVSNIKKRRFAFAFRSHLYGLLQWRGVWFRTKSRGCKVEQKGHSQKPNVPNAAQEQKSFASPRVSLA